MSLKLKLLNKVKSEQRLWHKGELSDYARDLGYSAENAGRRLRELEEAGLIKRTLNKKNMVLYYAPSTDLSFYEKPEEPVKEKLQFGNTRQLYALKYKKPID